VLEEIDRYGIPFMDRYSDLRNLKDRLTSSEPTCFTLNKEARICLRAAIVAFEGHPAEALRIVDEAIEERRGALPKYRIALEQLRTRLVSLSDAERR